MVGSVHSLCGFSVSRLSLLQVVVSVMPGGEDTTAAKVIWSCTAVPVNSVYCYRRNTFSNPTITLI